MKVILFLSIALFMISCSTTENEREISLDYAKALSQKFILVDTHIDLPENLYMSKDSMEKVMREGNMDYLRSLEGGLNAPFMSIYTPARTEFNGATVMADSLITLVEIMQSTWPERYAIAKTPADVRSQFAKGLISLPMGMENGSPIKGKLENLRHFYNRGIRYITLAHSKSNHICDSSYDPEYKWNGLSPFGRTVVEKMNELGIMIDISHVSDSTFYQVIRMTKAPVIASHSSCRYFTPGFERNMSDEMIKALAKNGGVIQITLGSSFLDQHYRDQSDSVRQAVRKTKLHWGTPEFEEFVKKYKKEHHINEVDVSIVAKHIDHVVKLVGIDHAGIGSDFDGVGDSLPVGLKDVSGYPNLIYELLKLGYSDEDIQKICGENLLRVWAQVEKVGSEK